MTQEVHYVRRQNSAKNGCKMRLYTKERQVHKTLHNNNAFYNTTFFPLLFQIENQHFVLCYVKIS